MKPQTHPIPPDDLLNDERLAQTLTNIAAEGVSEDMDLWPTISNAAYHTRRAAHWIPHTRLGWVAAVIAALMMVTAGAYAIGALLQSGDPGLDAVAEEITYFNETQTQDNLSVTLDYAYADANRISIAYSGELEFPADAVNYYTYTEVVLTDENGLIFERIPFGGGGGGGGGGGTSETVTLAFGEVANFDASIIEGTPDVLNLSLTLTFSAPAEAAIGAITGGGGGSGGGGGGGPEGAPTQVTQSQTTPEPIAYEPVVFEFSVPFLAGKRLPAPMTASTSDLDVVLNQVIVTPSLTRLELCFDAPVPEDPEIGVRYVPYISLSVGDEIVAEDLQLINGTQLASDTPCRTYLLSEGLYDREGDWALTVHRLALSNSADPDAAMAAFEEAGIEVERVEEGGFRFMPPEGADLEAYFAEVDRIYQSLQFQIDGEWVYQFDLNQ